MSENLESLLSRWICLLNKPGDNRCELEALEKMMQGTSADSLYDFSAIKCSSDQQFEQQFFDDIYNFLSQENSGFPDVKLLSCDAGEINISVQNEKDQKSACLKLDNMLINFLSFFTLIIFLMAQLDSCGEDKFDATVKELTNVAFYILDFYGNRGLIFFPDAYYFKWHLCDREVTQAAAYFSRAMICFAECHELAHLTIQNLEQFSSRNDIEYEADRLGCHYFFQLNHHENFNTLFLPNQLNRAPLLFFDILDLHEHFMKAVWSVPADVRYPSPVMRRGHLLHNFAFSVEADAVEVYGALRDKIDELHYLIERDKDHLGEKFRNVIPRIV